jgi:hypothetical protein
VYAPGGPVRLIAGVEPVGANDGQLTTGGDISPVHHSSFIVYSSLHAEEAEQVSVGASY